MGKHTKWTKHMPPRDLLDDSIDIRELWTVSHSRQPMPNGVVDHFLSFLLFFGIHHQGFDSRMESESRLFRDMLRCRDHLSAKMNLQCRPRLSDFEIQSQRRIQDAVKDSPMNWTAAVHSARDRSSMSRPEFWLLLDFLPLELGSGVSVWGVAPRSMKTSQSRSWAGNGMERLKRVRYQRVP